MPTLMLQLPGLPSVSHTLKDGTITLGRMRGNSIVIDDDSVSLMHAKIIGRDGIWLVKDMNSTNGTLLNGQSVTESRLRDNDKLTFGDVKGQFSMETFAEAAMPAMPQPIAAARVEPEIVAAAAPMARPAAGAPLHSFTVAAAAATPL